MPALSGGALPVIYYWQDFDLSVMLRTMSRNPSRFIRQRPFQRLLTAAFAGGGLVCLITSLIWIGCASGAGNSRPNPPPSAWQPAPQFPAVAGNLRFKENILFLKEANVPVAEVYGSFGAPDWESKALRLLAYRAQNHQALFVTYGTNNLVTRHAVKKLKTTDSLEEAASGWQRSN